jgi:hypothetical protein
LRPDYLHQPPIHGINDRHTFYQFSRPGRLR